MNVLKKIFGLDKSRKDPIETEDLENLDAEGMGMVRGIVELSDTPVKEVMIPRIDTVFVPEAAVADNSLAEVIQTGHSRFPVYRENIDNVVGVLYVKDLLPSLLEGQPKAVVDVLRPAYFVPESMKLDSLLKEMKQRRVHLAVAVDEYGGVSGIISMEDILEEIVGDIQDEFDNEGEEIVSVGEGQWICDARVNIEDLNEELGSTIPDDDFDTLGGFVFDLFGKIPGRYEKIEWSGLVFVIQSVEGHKIRKVKILREVSGG
ncbi:MAG: hemolysin family protein [Spirochaetales bacterium]|nr:hemolysin family protein [Spirochaetales bacterium]